MVDFHPKQGSYLCCDFDRTFIVPEITKERPVVVISNSDTHSGGRRLCTVIALSTTPPNPICSWHHQLSYNPHPIGNKKTQVWAKCDMIYTVSYGRLSRYYKKSRSGRNWLNLKIANEDLIAILNCVQTYISRGALVKR